MTALELENISKRYFLGESRATSIRDLLAAIAAGRRQTRREIWALRNISFAAEEGETLGIIGHNGAGKSTLLKILSRITRPTSGTGRIRGRVGSLLEVGTGFHNELTGRENIYLNGAILGMRRAEIDEKFDEIVAFSELEKFLDTPVKHYSSGMYMRLAFAIAAHLEPEILIVDEVLAVGDINFQRKCLAKMRDVGETGRTVIFVSHDMQAVTRLCRRAIWLRGGEVVRDGPAAETVAEYLHEQSQTGSYKCWPDDETAPGNEIVRLREIRVCDEDLNPLSAADIRKPVIVEMTYRVLQGGRVLIPNLHFFNEQGICIFISHDWFSGWRDRPRPEGLYVSRVRIPGNFLSEGWIYVGAAVSTYKPLMVHFAEWDAVTFNVIDKMEGDSARGDYAGVLPGIVRPVLDWTTEQI
jgi:lipopolysaccharide transport system ATP-binding protein